MSLSPGTRIGPYEVLAKLGEGGMGEVYRARDTKLDREVAIKVLPESFAADPDRLMRFEREAKTLATLNHPHIAQIYGVEDRALVMELVDGEDLAQRIARGSIPVDEALPIARQIAEALDAAHQTGIIHRDLKPANIKLRADGKTKVLDFGLAKLAGTESSEASSSAQAVTSPAITMQGVVLGTAAYMAPEQAKGRTVDKRADIWAFGCVLFEMLSGRRAFEGDDVSDTLAAVLRGDPDWSALPRPVHSAVRVLLRRCLQRDPTRRIADASTVLFVLDEIESLARGDDVAVADVGRQVSTAVATTRRALLRVFVPVVAVLIAAVATLAALIGFRAPAAAPQPARFAIALPPEQQAISALNRGALAMSQDGSRMAWAASGGIFVRAIGELEAHLIAGSFAGASPQTPLFAPDGGSIVFFVFGQLKRLAVSGGSTVDLCAVAGPLGLSWHETGILVGQGAQGVRRCPLEGGTAEQIATVSSGEEAHGGQLLPDGDGLLMSVARTSDGAEKWNKAQIVVQSLRSGARTLVVSGGSDARYLPSGHLTYALGGVLLAVPFDPSTRTVTGVAVPVIEGVRRPIGGVTGIAHYAVSSTGTLIYLPGPARPTSDYALALADRGGTVTRLPVRPQQYAHVRASRDGTRLAIGTDDGAQANVWLYEPGGNTELQRLTLDGKSRFPIWSPDGQRLAFQSDRGGDLGIYIQRLDGSAPAERLTTAPQGEAHVPESWSPDGKLIAYAVEKDGAYSLATVVVADKVSTPFGDVRSIEPIGSAFSPDGRWMLYTSSPEAGGTQSVNRGVFIQPFPATGTVYQVPKQSLDFHPAWASSGGEVVFVVSAVSGRLAVVPFSNRPRVSFGSPTILQARVTGDRTSGLRRAWDILPDGRFVGIVPTTDSGEGTMRLSEVRVVLNWHEELKRRVPTP